MSDRVQRLAADLRTDDPRAVHDAAITLSQEATTGRALELLGAATALNQRNGAHTNDRVVIEPDGRLVISNPYSQVTEAVQTRSEPYSPDRRPCEPDISCRSEERPPVVYRDRDRDRDRDDHRIFESRPPVEYGTGQEQQNRVVPYAIAGAAAAAIATRNPHDRLRNAGAAAIIGGVVGDIVDQTKR